MKKYYLLIAFLIVYTVIARAGCPSRPNNYVNGQVIKSADVNLNETTLYNALCTGQFDIANNYITDAMISSAAAIQDTKFKCSGSTYWATLSGCGGTPLNADLLHTHSFSATTTINLAYATGTISATQHGDLSAATSTMHSATSTVITDNNDLYNSTNVEGALWEVANYIGYSTQTAAATSSWNAKVAGFAIDFTASWPTTNPTASIVIPINTSKNGISVTITANVQTSPSPASFCNVNVPLAVNGVNLSTSGTPDYRYEVYMGSSNATVATNSSTTMVYRVTDGWNPAIENTVSIGTVFAGGTGCVAATAENFQIIIFSLN
jgi:hypothetical protein